MAFKLPPPAEGISNLHLGTIQPHKGGPLITLDDGQALGDTYQEIVDLFAQQGRKLAVLNVSRASIQANPQLQADLAKLASEHPEIRFGVSPNLMPRLVWPAEGVQDEE